MEQAEPELRATFQFRSEFADWAEERLQSAKSTYLNDHVASKVKAKREVKKAVKKKVAKKKTVKTPVKKKAVKKKTAKKKR